MDCPPTDLYGLTRPELDALVESWGFSVDHSARLWKYLYLGLAGSFEQLPEIPARVRSRLAAETRIGALRVSLETESNDGFTRKFLLGLPDGGAIETVLMRFTGRATACVSSQVGCAMGCVFCATGQMGFRRHLAAGEIVSQVVHAARALRAREPRRLRNVVLMGMGEPLHNYDAVMRAVDIMRDPGGLGLGAERITLSTVGVVPGIRRMADEARPIHLAVSLHSANQEERAAMVPAARRWPLDELMDACRHFCATLNRRIFFEWTLIAGRNDTADHAHAVGRLIRGLPAQVNLIPLNPTAGFSGAPSRTEAARRFQGILTRDYGLPSTVRQRRGIDIAAGCGQLAAPAGTPVNRTAPTAPGS
ncbi:MAG TPA: 23S rRNA (adenine(2503)-C(2))-methyltransferase RlmN [Opitutaceae bacterium]|nr:23S rRNA (adenine(2503)-C(2))-methyltransferase RlmN [Opitutaceae bacterium]